MTPYYRRIINFLKNKGLKHFIVDTDGNVSELIPLFIEAGMTGMYPFEVQAGNDILNIRKDYPKLQIFGGINKNELANANNFVADLIRRQSQIAILVKNQQPNFLKNPNCLHRFPL